MPERALQRPTAELESCERDVYRTLEKPAPLGVVVVIEQRRDLGRNFRRPCPHFIQPARTLLRRELEALVEQRLELAPPLTVDQSHGDSISSGAGTPEELFLSAGNSELARNMRRRQVRQVARIGVRERSHVVHQLVEDSAVENDASQQRVALRQNRA